MSGRLSEAAEHVREAGAEDSGRGCWVMVSLGVSEAEVSTRAAVSPTMETNTGYRVIIARAVSNV